MHSSRKRLAALIAAGAVAFGSATVGAPAAFAQTTTPPVGAETPAAPAAPAPTGLIDPAAQVSLTIHKYLGETGDTSTNLAGSQFKIDKIDGLDLTTQASWAELANMSGTNLNGHGTTNVTTLTTGADGTASISTADTPAFTVGAYLVTEQNRAGYSTAAPFLVVLPHSENGQWNYTQAVNPKNQQQVATKQVDDTGATIGESLHYTINSPVPGGEVNRYIVRDDLMANLTMNPSSVAVSADGVADLAASDYTISTVGQNLTVEFTDAGRAKLQAARATNPGMQVHVAFDATVNSLPADGVISNTANIDLPNGATINTDADINGNNQPTSTTFGTLTITKTTTNGTQALNGAEFQLYQCSVENQGQANEKWTVLGEPLNVATTETGAPATTLTTAGSAEGDPASNATVNGYGVPISSVANGVGTVGNEYCVLESKAPAGYVRNPEPQHVTINAAARTLTVSVDNQKDSILNQLPATGAWGIVLVFLVGLALLARGIYTSYKDRAAA